MSLSPEDRQRIYEEEKARVEARDRAQRELQSKKQSQGCQTCLAGCGIFFVFVLVMSLGPCSSNSSSRTSDSGSSSYTPPVIQKPLTAKEKKEQQRQEQAAIRKEKREEAERLRRAKEEYDVDGLVLLVKSVRATSGEYGGEITGTVINRRDRTLNYTQITFNLYDKSGAQVGSALANINGLEPGARWKFKASTFGTDFEKYRFSDLTGF